jgi:hypothetical protein
MSTYSNGTQQTYKEIWAGMELSCACLMPAMKELRGTSCTVPEAESLELHGEADVAASSAKLFSTILGIVAEVPAAVTLAGAGIEWPDHTVNGHRRRHPLRTLRRSARGRRRIAARIR